MKIIDVKQQSPEWHELRKLKLTASNAQAIANQGKGLDTLILKLVAAYVSKGVKKRYSNEDMERGVALESQARTLYQLQTGIRVQEIGFVLCDEFIGFSPDGFAGKNGLLEIKCKDDEGHLEHLLYGAKAIESTYQWQMQMGMFLGKKEWCDYVCHNPNFEKHTLVYRVEPDLKKHIEIEKGLELGVKKIKEILEALKCQPNH